MKSSRQYKLLLTDIIDALTINQIKEVAYDYDRCESVKQEIEDLSHDLSLLLKERDLQPTGRLVRLTALLAQSNLHVWFNKDCMQEEPEKYYELLEFAQELNGLRNHVRNVLMSKFSEADACTLRTTFLCSDNSKWYAPILKSLAEPDKAP
jgi:hypothetical protein